ncbi:MAG: hypothetical protein WCH34_04815 [Bacteroidota bacterium]
MESELLKRFSTKIGISKYHFDILIDEKFGSYLEITEVKKEGNKQRIIIISEDMKIFGDAFNRSRKELRKHNRKIKKALSFVDNQIDEESRYHPNANKHWNSMDDEKLEKLYIEGKSISELAQIFGRKDVAIVGRLKKIQFEDHSST